MCSKEADRAEDLAAEYLPPRWSELAVPTGDLQRYRISRRFERGQWLDHVKFGPGFVTSVSADKLTAVFEQGVKTLVHGRG